MMFPSNDVYTVDELSSDGKISRDKVLKIYFDAECFVVPDKNITNIFKICRKNSMVNNLEVYDFPEYSNIICNGYYGSENSAWIGSWKYIQEKIMRQLEK